jgi:hypothetical protein
MQSNKSLYPFTNSSEDFLKDRPDFYLGRFFYMFADEILLTNYELDCDSAFYNNEIKSILNRMILEVFGTSINGLNVENDCTNTTQNMLQSHYETFLDVVLYSQIGFDGKIGNSRIDFKNKYANISAIFSETKPVEPKYLVNQFGIIPFCEFANNITRLGVAKSEHSECNRFQPFLTTNGLCYTLNSLTMNQIFKKSEFIESWANVQEDVTPIKPTGSGPSNGFYFILNSFERVSSLRFSNNIIMSITNENNPFDVYKQNYLIEPGRFYMFRVLASQMVTTNKFDLLDVSLRNCSLPSENRNLKLFQKYSKSGCEYECSIEQAIQKCQCISWSIPQVFEQQLPYCSLYEKDCFDEALKSKAKQNCNCLEDCYGTSFSVFPSIKDLVIPPNFCSDENIKDEFPFPIYCSLCKNIIKTHKMRFVYDNIMKGSPNPDNLDEFCNKFVHQNVAIVKIEMATKFITRSVKDERNSFVSQLSSIGKKHFLS